MNAIADIWRQLVRRRLWPVAALLLAALVAVPWLLASEPVPSVAPAAQPATAQASPAVLEPIVAPATADDRAKRRKVLGKEHDIFKPTAKPAKTPKRPAAAKPEPVKATPAPAPAKQAPSSGGGGSPAPTEAPSEPVAPAPAEKPDKPAVEPHALTVRFGRSEATTAAEKVEVGPLDALPSKDEPVLIYLGLSKDRKTAHFMLDAGVTATGDGRCEPSPESCETIHLRAGETEFLDVAGADAAQAVQYQLDLVRINE